MKRIKIVCVILAALAATAAIGFFATYRNQDFICKPSFMREEAKSFRCYRADNSHLFYYPNDWQESDHGDIGFFKVDDVSISITHIGLQYMMPVERYNLGSGGISALLSSRARYQCRDYPGLCPTFIDVQSTSMGFRETNLHHYRTPQPSAENPDGYIDEYTIGYSLGSIQTGYYYEMRIIIPSTVSAEVANQRLEEFKQVAKTFTWK